MDLFDRIIKNNYGYALNIISSMIDKYGVRHSYLDSEELAKFEIELLNKYETLIIKYTNENLDPCIEKILKGYDLYRFKPGNANLLQVCIYGNHDNGYVIFEKNDDIPKKDVFIESKYDQPSFLPTEILMKISFIDEDFNLKELGLEEFKIIQKFVKNNSDDDVKEGVKIYYEVLLRIAENIHSNWHYLCKYYNDEIIKEIPVDQNEELCHIDEKGNIIYTDKYRVVIQNSENKSEMITLMEFLFNKVDHLFRQFFIQTGRSQEFFDISYETMHRDSRKNALHNTIKILSKWGDKLDLYDDEKVILHNFEKNIIDNADHILMLIKRIDTEVRFHPKTGEFFYTFLFQLIIFYIKHLHLLNLYDDKIKKQLKKLLDIKNEKDAHVIEMMISDEGKRIFNFLKEIDGNHLEIYCLMYFKKNIIEKYPDIKNKKSLHEDLIEVWKLIDGKVNKIRQKEDSVKIIEPIIDMSFFAFGTKRLSFNQYFYASILLDEEI